MHEKCGKVPCSCRNSAISILISNWACNSLTSLRYHWIKSKTVPEAACSQGVTTRKCLSKYGMYAKHVTAVQGWVPWTHNPGISKSRKWQNIATAQNSRKWHLLALMIIHISLWKGFLMYYCGMGWGGRCWHLCFLIRADLMLVKQRQDIFTRHKTHIGLRGLKSIRGFPSFGGGRQQLPSNAATALEGGPWAVLEASKACRSWGWWLQRFWTESAGQKWNSCHTAESFGLCELNWELQSSSRWD